MSYIGKPQECMNFLYCQDKDALFEVKEHRDKYSRNALNYMWALVGQIADVMRIPKDDCYVEMLRHYGQSEIISVLSDINISGYFKYFDEIGKGSVEGKQFTHYRIYKGVSEFDSREMAILIDGVVHEAEQLDICTLSSAEIERLVEQWGKKHSK